MKNHNYVLLTTNFFTDMAPTNFLSLNYTSTVYKEKVTVKRKGFSIRVDYPYSSESRTFIR